MLLIQTLPQIVRYQCINAKVNKHALFCCTWDRKHLKRSEIVKINIRRKQKIIIEKENGEYRMKKSTTYY